MPLNTSETTAYLLISPKLPSRKVAPISSDHLLVFVLFQCSLERFVKVSRKRLISLDRSMWKDDQTHLCVVVSVRLVDHNDFLWHISHVDLECRDS